MFETTVLATINVELYVKYDFPQFSNWVLNIFECFFFHFFMLESGELRKKQKLHNKCDNIRKRKPV